MKIGKRANKRVGTAIRYLLLLVLAIPMILPLLWMISTALKSDNAVFSVPPEWIPKEFQWSNFTIGLEQIEFWKRFLNTSIISVLACIGQVISSMCVGYAIARLKFPGKKIWFYLIVGSMMLPGMVSLIPVFKLYSAMGWYDTWLPMIIPNFLGAPFFIFMARQFMSVIPKSYDEAAKIDGASRLQVLVKVIMPMCKPLVATIVIMQFQCSWNDYLTPLIYLMTPEKWTLSLALGQFMNGTYGASWNLFMAADIFYLLPILLLFFFAQNYFMEGLGSMNNVGIK